MTAESRIRYLWAYSAGNDATVGWHERLLARRKARGFDVEGFCVTPTSLDRRWLPFPELDLRWRTGHPALMRMYAELAERLHDRDVLILYNGANLHPEFVNLLSVFKVYTAGDDPESTEVLTKPAAPAFDIHLVNNAACIEMYRSWGLKHVYFWPLGSMTTEEEVADLSEDTVLDISERTLAVVFFGERNRTKGERLDQLSEAFPEALCAGRGWPEGFIGEAEMVAAYRRAQIGWNVHNSSGPINFRLYDLPAYGVMQICDNKSHLGRVYEIGKEVIGFDSIEECIELTRYYLAHPAEQRQIAAAGRRRWKKDYTPDAVWARLSGIVETHRPSFPASLTNVSEVKSKLLKHARRSYFRRQAWHTLSYLRYYSRRMRRSFKI